MRVFMPYVLAFNRKAIEAKIKRLAGYIGIDGGFDGFLDAVLELRKQIGVPHDLGGLKVDGGKVDTIVEMSLEDPTAGGNPGALDQRGKPQIVRGRAQGRCEGGGLTFEWGLR